MTFPANYSRIWLRGWYIDLGKAARGEPNIGVTRPLTFQPSPSILINMGTRQIINTAGFTATPSIVDGYVQIQVPATDDPDIVPTDWTYSVTEPSGRSYNLVVPWETAILDEPESELHGERVIELISVVPAPSPNPGTIQIIEGRGLTSITVIDGYFVATYTDGTQSYISPVPAGDGGVTEALVDSKIETHSESPTPHTAYDDIPSLSLVFQNGLV